MKLYVGLLCLAFTVVGLVDAQKNPAVKSCRQGCAKTLIPVCSLDGKTFKNDCLLRCSGKVKQCNGPCPCRRAGIQQAPPPSPTPAPKAQAVEVEIEDQPVKTPSPVTPRPQPVYQQQPAKPNPRPFYQQQPTRPNPQPFYQQQPVQPRPQSFYPPQPIQPRPQPFYPQRQYPVQTTTPAPTPPPTQPPFYYDPFAFLFEPIPPAFVPLPQPVFVPTVRPDFKDKSCYCGNEKDPVCTVDGEEYENSCKATCDGKLIACENKCPCMYT